MSHLISEYAQAVGRFTEKDRRNKVFPAKLL